MGGWFRDGFQGGRESPAACRGVIQMTAPIPQTAFRGPGDNLIGGVLAHLRLADRLPLRISCHCRARWDDPALDQLHFEREVDLGTFGDLAAAMIVARTAVTSGLIAAGNDPALRLAPQFITILDAEQRLVLVGEAPIIPFSVPTRPIIGPSVNPTPIDLGGATLQPLQSITPLWPDLRPFRKLAPAVLRGHTRQGHAHAPIDRNDRLSDR